ncbi:MAG: hypothetical protein ACD_24C00032G0002 [uncultured bacterium]|nr:MAG: hypothetical protein ACD_24C00032G0002 [uncultured bacterium]
MNGSIIVFGSDQNYREKIGFEISEKLGVSKSENNPDIKIVKTEDDKKSIGIDEIREVIKFLSNKPFSHKCKVVVITEAHYMTREAQNALLKILEEPPIYATLILLAKTEESVLPTILSRCRKISLKREMKIGLVGETPNIPSFLDLLNQSTGERLEWASETAKMDKKEIIDYLEKLIIDGRNYLNEYKGNGSLAMINNLNKVKLDLENTNLNTKIALEFLAVNAGSQSHITP